MVKIIKNILFLLKTLLVFSSVAQDVPLSQYYNSLLFVNPAFAGAATGNRVTSFYRNQWPQVSSGFVTYGLAYDQYLNKYKSGFGLIAQNDKSGIYSNFGLGFAYSYHVNITQKAVVKMGLQANLNQKYRLANELEFEDEEEISGGLNKFYPDFGIGAVVFFKKWYTGGAIGHLNKPKTDFQDSESSRLKLKFTGQLGYVINFETKLLKQNRVLIPNILYQQQGFHQNITWGASFQYDYILGGLFIRNNVFRNIDVIILSAGFKTSKYRIAYSYDINIGKKTLIPLGAHEISLTLVYAKKEKKKYKAVPCATFLD